MNCIIVDDEPLAREAMKLLIEEAECLQLVGSFNSAATASDFMEQHVVDLVFLDIQTSVVSKGCSSCVAQRTRTQRAA